MLLLDTVMSEEQLTENTTSCYKGNKLSTEIIQQFPLENAVKVFSVPTDSMAKASHVTNCIDESLAS